MIQRSLLERVGNMKTAIKICGLRDPKMAQKSVEWGAHYIGIICHPSSKRYVEPALGKQIAEAVKAAKGIPVAVFVDHDAEQMVSLCETMDIDTVQLAGSMARQTHARLPKQFRRIYVLPVNKNGVVQADVDQGLSKRHHRRSLGRWGADGTTHQSECGG